MAALQSFSIEVFLANGARLQTQFRQLLDNGQRPAARFYLGYSSDRARNQDLPWIAVGDIAYLPDEVVAVRVVPNDLTGESQQAPEESDGDRWART